jgi:serine/threonine protein kinase
MICALRLTARHTPDYIIRALNTILHSASPTLLNFMLSIIAGTTTRTQTVFGAEDPKMYHRQGLHPVHLGDTFVGRYTVVHKLGHGASSTIWLVEDTKTCSYASLKIISAAQSASQSCVELVVLRHLQDTFSEKEEGSRHVARMLDHFMHDGPNGRHQCIVEEALGPSLASYVGFVWDEEVIPADIVRQLVGQIALGVEYLHKRNVVHGDLHQGNILLCPPTPMATLAGEE